MSLLEVNSLSASYGEGQVLVDINLSVSEGSVVALMGRNGMGKTSIIKSYLDNFPIRGNDPYEKTETVKQYEKSYSNRKT